MEDQCLVQLFERGSRQSRVSLGAQLDVVMKMHSHFGIVPYTLLIFLPSCIYNLNLERNLFNFGIRDSFCKRLSFERDSS